MARIRSIFPGFWTDETTMTLSVECPIAICAAQGLWNEADDQGVFEWKPIVLKARILPGPSIDFSELLDRLVALNVIMQFEIDGKKYGAIRNFRKWQKPHTPNAIHPTTETVRRYVRLPATPKLHDFRSDTEADTPREETLGDGKVPPIPPKGGDKGGKPPPKPREVKARPANRAYSEDFERIWRAYPTSPNESKATAWVSWCRQLESGELPGPDQLAVAVKRQLKFAAESERKNSKAPPFKHPHFVTWLNQKRYETLLDHVGTAEKAQAQRKAEIMASGDPSALNEHWQPIAAAFTEKHGEDAWGRLVENGGKPTFIGGGDVQLEILCVNAFWRDRLTNDGWLVKVKAVAPADNPPICKVKR